MTFAGIMDGSAAEQTANQATGANDGPGLPLIGAGIAAAYVGYKVVFDGGM